MDDLLAAHKGINEIIKEFYPDNTENEESIINVRSSFSSLNNSSQAVTDFLECISLLDAARQDLASISEKIDSARLCEISSELMHPDIMGERAKWCQEAEKHLRTISESKDFVIYLLQQPLVTNYLTLHHKYHKSLITLVEELVDILNSVEGHIKLVEDHAQNSILQKAESSTNNVARMMPELRSTLDSIVSLQTVVTGMIYCQDSKENTSGL